MYHIKKSWKEIKKSLLNQKLLIYRLLDIYRLKMANQCRISGERRGAAWSAPGDTILGAAY